MIVQTHPEPASASPPRDAADLQAGLGAIARELRQALHDLGAAPELQRVIREIPDARSRLAYVGEMTEKAAHRVLNLVEDAIPKAGEHERQANRVAALLDRQAGSPVPDAPGAAPVMDEMAAFARESAAFAAEHRRVLGDIMLTQDFQDLSGQVVKKVIDMITRTENQLVRLLVDEGTQTAEPAIGAALEGPQTPETAMAQDDVDDLLASLDF